ncbi:unnamed protein product [Meloidogyne enterolobii]|uniref:Uncharacterized protein n=1 Tax=Meloidogyne enterolobii TaxID=390850 RepID=A0ACB0ZE20_MELEN
MDILVDSNLRPWLIEMNISPSLHSSTPLDIAVKAPLAKDTLILAGIPFPEIREDICDVLTGSDLRILSKGYFLKIKWGILYLGMTELVFWTHFLLKTVSFYLTLPLI